MDSLFGLKRISENGDNANEIGYLKIFSLLSQKTIENQHVWHSTITEGELR